LGESKHKDYFSYHLKKNDIKKLNASPITGFVYRDEALKVESIRSPKGRVINPTQATRALAEAIADADRVLAS
jgi:hypothetical protein